MKLGIVSVVAPAGTTSRNGLLIAEPETLRDAMRAALEIGSSVRETAA